MNDGPLDNLIRMLAALPGLGQRSGRRIALHLLSRKDTAMLPLGRALEQAARDIRTCNVCGNLDTTEPCRVCRNTARDAGVICIVAQVSDVWAIERTQAFKGVYHVLGGLLSALDGIGPDELSIRALENRLRAQPAREIILALSATVDGQSTAHFVADLLSGTGAKITRLAHGMPVGGELDYLDDGTIMTALKARG